MTNTNYVTLTRQSGLMQEMNTVANNLANMSTTGYRSEGVIFSEYVQRLDGEAGSLSMGHATGRNTSITQGALLNTGGAFDLAIEGDGYFLIETGLGQRLSRAGNFLPNEVGELVTPDGNRLLDAGGAPVFVPPEADIAIAADGTVSADGRPLSQIGLYQPTDPAAMKREDGVRFDPGGGVEPVEGASIVQGHLEQSNVDPVGEVTRMIEVQRAYELGQSFLDKEDERQRAIFRAMGR